MTAARWRQALALVCLLLFFVATSSHEKDPTSEPRDHNNSVNQTTMQPLKAKPKSTPTPVPSEEDQDSQDLQDLLGETITNNAVGSSGDDEAATAAVTAWAPVTLTPDTARVALDAVRYRNNYEKYITTRLCLHRINLIRSRLVDDLTSYLFSVDGCESTKITPTGRCDIYYCKLATYELKVTQKTANKDLFIVQSIFKVLMQKAMSELMAPSNLDFNELNDDDGQERLLAQATPQEAWASELKLPSSQQTVVSQGAGFVVGLVVALVVKFARRERAPAQVPRVRQVRARRRRQPWLRGSSSSLLSEHSGLLVSSASHQASNNNTNLEAV